MTDPRWEALRKAAQVVLDNGYAPCECAGDVTCLVCDMRAALAALEEPAPSEEGSRPEVSRGHASWCDLRTPKETLGVLRCTCGWEEARPAPSKALDREALADAYGIACVNYAPLEGRIGPRDHPKFVRAKDARAALLAAWEAEVAALRAEVEKERKTAGLEYQSGSIWRQRALAAEAALATERARAAIWTTRDDWKKRFAPARNICNAESSVGHHCQKSPGHEGQHRDRYWNEWPAPAPQGEERCPECDSGTVIVGHTRYTCSGCHGTGRAPRAEEGT